MHLKWSTIKIKPTNARIKFCVNFKLSKNLITLKPWVSTHFINFSFGPLNFSWKRIPGHIFIRSTGDNQPLGMVKPHYTTHEKSLISIKIYKGLRLLIWVSWSAGASLIATLGAGQHLPNIVCSNFRTQTTKATAQSRDIGRKWNTKDYRNVLDCYFMSDHTKWL